MFSRLWMQAHFWFCFLFSLTMHRMHSLWLKKYKWFPFYRFEHREENRKDCLRTLFALIEEAGKATKLAEEARVSYCKNRLRANPAFMVRLHSKITGQGSNSISAWEFNTNPRITQEWNLGLGKQILGIHTSIGLYKELLAGHHKFRGKHAHAC